MSNYTKQDLPPKYVPFVYFVTSFSFEFGSFCKEKKTESRVTTREVHAQQSYKHNAAHKHVPII